MKRTRKVVSTLVTVAMVGTLVLPIAAGPAFAASDNRVSKVINVADDYEGKLGTLSISEDEDYAGDFTSGETFTLTLPSNVEWADGTNNDDKLDVRDYIDGPVTARLVNDQTLELKFTDAVTSKASKIADVVDIDMAIVVDGAEGDIKVSIDGRDSGVTEGDYLIARVSSGSTVTTAMDTKTMGDGFSKGGTIRIEETSVNAIGTSEQEIKLKLPNNFVWSSDYKTTKYDDVKDYITFSGGFSPADFVKAEISDRNLTITIDPASSRTQRGVIYVVPYFKADKKADYGDIEINVSGDEIDDADVIVATYADFGIELAVDDVETVVAGQYAQETGTLTIEEAVPGTLIAGRDLTIELPSWVKITKVKTKVKKGDNSFNVKVDEYDGEDNTIDLNIENGTKKTAAKIEVDFEVSVQANKSGDIEAVVSGKSGGEGEIVIAKAVAPVSVESVAKAQLKIGVQDQPMSDIIITETAAGNILEKDSYNKDGQIVVKLPANIEWGANPKVEVTEGNLEIDEDNIDTSGSYLYIPVDSESSKASKIKISNIIVDINRVVPEGPVEAKIMGNALVENNKESEGWLDDAKPTGDDKGNVGTLDAGEFDTDNVVKVVVGTVVTPAPEAGTAVFNVGSSIYTAGGVTKVMDAAPYIKEGRTYVPVRYLALALGVAEEDIAFENGVVTLTKGESVVTLTIGSTVLTQNDSTVTMDVAPEVNNGRTMLPARFVAEAFGAMVGYANGQVVISQ
ncbi:copper amine oxidase N-terminal domain-containing protein [Desulfotomaculum sp. 1211_IL3151]|uniref:copper amine oxidase N-terminal domain-containing protein n=1 Tax=Desulfotomaculum sp. 1211_IL3151 TaxID=3084055 RepID=UPI002FD9B7A0